jgi:ribosomal protein L24
VIAPVVVFRLKPAGRDGEIAKVIGAVPPVVVTGVKDAADDAVSVSDAMASVVERADEITSANVLALVALVASVAVTV